MASRISQSALEALQGPGNPGARATQAAVEVLVGPGVASERVSQAAVEVLATTAPVAAADVRQTQQPLEVALQSPPAAGVRETQAGLETVLFPPNTIWATQVCLEVALPAFIPVVTARNYAYTGGFART